MDKLIKQIKKARFIWTCGNGGSAATAEHLTADLIKKGYPAVCLNSNTAVITMLANDYGYEHIFSEQLKVLGDGTDLLITISCSGTSQNILNVEGIALRELMPIFKFETFGRNKNYGKLEDKHLAFAHKIASKL